MMDEGRRKKKDGKRHDGARRARVFWEVLGLDGLATHPAVVRRTSARGLIGCWRALLPIFV